MNAPYLFDTSCIDCSNCLGGYNVIDSFCQEQCLRCNAVVESNPFPNVNYPRFRGNPRFPFQGNQNMLYYSPRRFSSANYYGSFQLPSIFYN